MAAPGQRGQFEKAKHPYAFPNAGGALAFARKSSSFEKIYDAITSTPAAPSDVYAINRCKRFTVKVYATGADLSCLVQVCSDPNIGDWFTLATLTNASPYYSSTNLFTSVRLNMTLSGGATAYAWLLRDYESGN